MSGEEARARRMRLVPAPERGERLHLEGVGLFPIMWRENLFRQTATRSSVSLGWPAVSAARALSIAASSSSPDGAACGERGAAADATTSGAAGRSSTRTLWTDAGGGSGATGGVAVVTIAGRGSAMPGVICVRTTKPATRSTPRSAARFRMRKMPA